MRTLFPQLATNCTTTSLEAFINDDRWVMEQKLDGHRLFLAGAPGGITATTRNGTPYTRKLPREITDFRFPEGDWILDGEFVDGKFWAFDMPLTPQADWKDKPLYQRRAALETFLNSVAHPFCLIPQARTRDEKIGLAEKAIGQCAEGLLLKLKDSPYRSAGRTEEWLKLKFVSTADCIVTDVRADGKDSVGLGLVDGVTVKPVGRASLIGKEKAGQIIAGDVIEVRYLYTGAQGRLYQPTILRLRDDKTPPECTIDQLKYVNKSVLETL